MRNERTSRKKPSSSPTFYESDKIYEHDIQERLGNDIMPVQRLKHVSVDLHYSSNRFCDDLKRYRGNHCRVNPLTSTTQRNIVFLEFYMPCMSNKNKEGVNLNCFKKMSTEDSVAFLSPI